METQEFISSLDEGKYIFTPQELQACAEQGDCCQCGLCCIVPNIKYIPEEPPRDVNDQVSITEKACMTVCPYLKETNEGLFQCSLQNIKDNPTLYTCHSWKGNQQRGNKKAYDIILDLVRVPYCNDVRNPDYILVINKMVKRGIIPHGFLTELLMYNNTLYNLLFTVFNELSVLPHALFENMELKEYLQRRPIHEIEQLIIQLDLLQEHPLKKEFVETYLSNLLETPIISIIQNNFQQHALHTMNVPFYHFED